MYSPNPAIGACYSVIPRCRSNVGGNQLAGIRVQPEASNICMLISASALP